MSQLESNKNTVIAFYQSAFDGNPEQAVADHVGDCYIQHNPQAKDGSAAFIDFVNYLRREYPQLRLDIKRVLGDGDLVVTHAQVVLTPEHPGRAVADFWRLDKGKIVEHWDVVQDVPDTSANINGMF